MNGKVLKVKQNNLQFGANERLVNILGCFKYKPNSNVYVIYTDTDTKYNIIYYGSGHIRQGIALCMKCRDKQEEEIIKEYIFKTINKENLDNFELYSLENIDAIEIIESDKIEVKPEILLQLTDIIMPKEELEEETTIETKPKKNTFLKVLLIFLILILVLITSVYFLLEGKPKENTEKNITCIKSYQHDILIATVEETNKYNFDNNDKLVSINTTLFYQFNQTNYQDFILKGTYYKYMPSSNEDSWDKNDEEYTFTTNTKKVIDVSYDKPTNYEEVLSYYKAEGFTCTEEIETN